MSQDPEKPKVTILGRASLAKPPAAKPSSPQDLVRIEGKEPVRPPATAMSPPRVVKDDKKPLETDIPASPKQRERDKVFISYSHKDHRFLEQLQTLLTPLCSHGQISAWDDTKIAAGSNWKEEIKAALDSAKVAVLLVSGDFLESSFIQNVEIPSLLEAARTDGVTILWVLVGKCLYDRTLIGRWQAAHDTKRPLNLMKLAQRQVVLTEVCRKIGEAAKA